MNEKGKGRTSLRKGINKALETNPGTSLDTVTSLSHATANPRARDNVSSDVCNAEISSTNFCSSVQRNVCRTWEIHPHHHRNGVEKMKSCPDCSFDSFNVSDHLTDNTRSAALSQHRRSRFPLRHSGGGNLSDRNRRCIRSQDCVGPRLRYQLGEYTLLQLEVLRNSLEGIRSINEGQSTAFACAPQSPCPSLVARAIPRHDRLRTRVLVLVVHPRLESSLWRHP